MAKVVEFLLIYWGKTDDEEAERQGSTDRQTGTETDRRTDRDKDRETETDRGRCRDRQRQGQRQRDTETESDRNRDRQTKGTKLFEQDIVGDKGPQEVHISSINLTLK